MTNPAAHPKFVRWAIVLGIVIVLNVFFAVLVSVALPAPAYEDFCPTSQVVPSYDTQDACVAAGGQWTSVNYPPPVDQMGGKPQVNQATPAQPTGYCDANYTCGAAYTAADASHTRDAFIAFVVLGVIALIVGVLPLGSSIVSSGLSYGGVVTLIVGSVQYWGSADKWIRLAISFVALLALLYIAWKRFRD